MHTTHIPIRTLDTAPAHDMNRDGAGASACACARAKACTGAKAGTHPMDRFEPDNRARN